MSVVLIEGFDHLGTTTDLGYKGWNQTSGFSTFRTTTTTRYGAGKSLAHNSDNAGSFRKSIGATYATLIMGFGFLTTNHSASTQFVQLADGSANVIAGVRLNTGTFRIEIVNSGGTVIATGTTAINNSAWYYIELLIAVNGASGSCALHVNGVQEVAPTTSNFGTSNIGTVIMNTLNVAGGDSFWDDIYMVDNSTFLGDVRVETIWPDGDGASSAWTPSTGTSHSALVDETTPNGDTDYVSSSNPGDVDLYTFGNLSSTVAIIHAVQKTLTFRKEDSAVRQIRAVTRQGSTNYDGTVVGTASTTYAMVSEIDNLDPTGASWTVANVNADQWGVKVVA